MLTSLQGSLDSRFTRPLSVPLWAAVLSLIVAALMGAAVVAAATSSTGASPSWVHGVVTAVNGDGRAIGFTEDGGTRQGEGVPIATECWSDADGSSYCGTPPPCLLPGSYGQRVELAILELSQGAWPQKLVVGIHCLS